MWILLKEIDYKGVLCKGRKQLEFMTPSQMLKWANNKSNKYKRGVLKLRNFLNLDLESSIENC